MFHLVRMFSGSIFDSEFRARSQLTRIIALKFFGSYFNFRTSGIPRPKRMKLANENLAKWKTNIIHTDKNQFIHLHVISAFGLQGNESGLILNKDTLSNPGFSLEKIYSRMNYLVDQPTQISEKSITAFTVLPYNFYHFMTDFVLPYLAQSDQLRQLFLPFKPTLRQTEILELFQIDFTNARFQANHDFKDIKILPTIFEERSHDWISSPNPTKNYGFNEDRLRKARKSVLKLENSDGGNFSEKVFISRKGATRSPEEIIRIENIFKNFGFEIYNAEEFGLEETIQIFQNARLIVGIHGAGLTNMVFAKPTCEVIEITPIRHKMGGDVRPVFELMAKTFEFDYKKLSTPGSLKQWIALASDL